MEGGAWNTGFFFERAVSGIAAVFTTARGAFPELFFDDGEREQVAPERSPFHYIQQRAAERYNGLVNLSDGDPLKVQSFCSLPLFEYYAMLNNAIKNATKAKK